MLITLSREEVLACVIALEHRKKPYGWEQSALAKFLKAMGLKPLPEKLNAKW